MEGKVMIDAERPPVRAEGFQDSEKLREVGHGEPRCECGHGLYHHYMCGGPATRCLTNCGCGSFRPESRKVSG